MATARNRFLRVSFTVTSQSSSQSTDRSPPFYPFYEQIGTIQRRLGKPLLYLCSPKRGIPEASRFAQLLKRSTQPLRRAVH